VSNVEASEIQGTLPAPEKPEKHSIEETVVAVILAAMVIILFAQVFARVIFSSSIVWSEEVARYLFIWLVFLGLGAVTLRGGHIAVDVLLLRLPAKGRRIATQTIYGIVFMINVVVIFATVRMIEVVLSLNQASPAANIPMGLVYLAVPIGVTLTSLRLLQVSLHLWKKPHGKGGI
jgi:C4-dicarboxylate transporter DctQ subunit